jgi:hypothetical protein
LFYSSKRIHQRGCQLGAESNTCLFIHTTRKALIVREWCKPPYTISKISLISFPLGYNLTFCIHILVLAIEKKMIIAHEVSQPIKSLC